MIKYLDQTGRFPSTHDFNINLNDERFELASNVKNCRGIRAFWSIINIYEKKIITYGASVRSATILHVVGLLLSPNVTFDGQIAKKCILATCTQNIITIF